MAVNVPAGLAPNFWLSSVNDGFTKACRFVVRINQTTELRSRFAYPGNDATFTRDLIYMCESAELPGRAFMNLDVRYYGPNQKLPFQSVYEDINLTFLVRAKSEEREFFDDWMTVINPQNTWDFAYRNEFATSIDIFSFEERGDEDGAAKVNYQFTLHNAYPIIVNPQPVHWASADIQRLVMTFTYTHWTRPTDPTARSADTSDGQYQLVRELGGRT